VPRVRARRDERLILITDGWLANAGDAAIHLAMRRSLRRRLPGHRVALACHQRALVGDRYPDLDLVSPLDGLVGVRWPWTSEEDIAGRDELDALLERADLVVVPGGGFLEEHYGPEARIRGWEYLLERGKRLVFYSQTIGAFADPALRERLARVLNAAELVLVRDSASADRVRALGIEPELTADEAFLLPRPRRRPRRPRSLLVTASTHPWATPDGAVAVVDEEIERLAETIARLLERGAARRVTLASTTQGLGGERWALEDDGIASRDIYDRLPARLRADVELVSGYVSAGDYLALAAGHTVAISMRMHGAILGAVGGALVVLANLSAKARDLGQRTAGGLHVIRDHAELARVEERLGELLQAPRRARAAQVAALESLRESALRSSRLVAGLVEPAG
jgi:polysaccharide pyruvyl transferase WcaK-like protein